MDNPFNKIKENMEAAAEKIMKEDEKEVVANKLSASDLKDIAGKAKPQDQLFRDDLKEVKQYDDQVQHSGNVVTETVQNTPRPESVESHEEVTGNLNSADPEKMLAPLKTMDASKCDKPIFLGNCVITGEKLYFLNGKKVLESELS